MFCIFLILAFFPGYLSMKQWFTTYFERWVPLIWWIHVLASWDRPLWFFKTFKVSPACVDFIFSYFFSRGMEKSEDAKVAGDQDHGSAKSSGSMLILRTCGYIFYFILQFPSIPSISWQLFCSNKYCSSRSSLAIPIEAICVNLFHLHRFIAPLLLINTNWSLLSKW